VEVLRQADFFLKIPTKCLNEFIVDLNFEPQQVEGLIHDPQLAVGFLCAAN
jgi:hypothetical protein